MLIKDKNIFYVINYKLNFCQYVKGIFKSFINRKFNINK